MFKLQPNPTFSIPVQIPVPGAAESTISILFKHKSKSEAQAFLARMNESDDASALVEIVAGWDGVDAEYSPAALAQLLDAYPGAGVALLEAWVMELMRARAKN